MGGLVGFLFGLLAGTQKAGKAAGEDEGFRNLILIDVAFFATDAKWLLLTHWLIDCN